MSRNNDRDDSLPPSHPPTGDGGGDAPTSRPHGGAPEGTQRITGWRLHIGAIFPTPVPPRFVREFYEVVPEGVDVTTNSLNVQQLSDSDLDEAVQGMERAAKQLANFDVDIIYQLGVPPVVQRGFRFGDELADRLSQASGLPAITDVSSVIAAMHARELKTVAMATPFETAVNEGLVQYLADQGIVVVHHTALGIKRNVEIRRLAIPVEYTVARKTYLESPRRPDGLYIPCGGWGSIHNVALLERDVDTTVVTWMNALIWNSMRRGKVSGPIQGFGNLLASL